MRLLKEEYEGLRKIRKLSQELKDFLLEPKIKTALENSDFNTLYKYSGWDSGKLTQLLNTLNIDPLDYLDYVPDNFLSSTRIKSINIPNHITRIGNEAFFDCTGLTSVTIPDSVTSIGDSAFNSCESLMSITIPNSVTSIGKSAFSGCIGLNSIIIPDSVTSIGQYTFYRCDGLTSITIGDSVTSIGKDTFWGCNSLTDIIYKSTKSNWKKIIKLDDDWYLNSSIKTVHCTDGDIIL